MSLKKCISSQWIIKIDRNAYAFNYDVKIFFEFAGGGQKRLFLSENNNNHFKILCRKAINGINELNNLVYAYDGCGSLWTPEALNTDIEVEIPQPDLDDFLKQHLIDPDGVLHVSLKKAKIIMMTDFTNSVDVAALVEDRSWRTLMELILSEDAVTRKDNPFVAHGPGCLIETKEHHFRCGLKYREGSYKGSHVINGNHGVPEMSLAMDYCRKVFFPSNENFQKFINDFIESGKTYDDAEILCWGLRLYKNDNRRQILRFKNFIGHNTPGEDIFADMKNSNEMFSLKDLQIGPDETVTIDAMTKDLKDAALNLNKFKPHDRKRLIEEQFQKLRLSNKVTAGFGVTVEKSMLEGTFDDSISVNVFAMNNQRLIQDEYGAFNVDCRCYFKRGNFKKVILLSTKNDRARVWEDIKTVVKYASNKSNAEVNAMVSFQEFDTTQQSLTPWVNALTKFNGNGNLIITVDESENSHGFLKFAEHATGVNTQHLKLSTISGVRFQTRKNIIHQTNIKMKGINYVVKFSKNMPLDLNSGKIFVLGLDVSHPTGGKYTDEPSFVGLSANYLQHSQEFGNLFFAQKTRQEIIDQSTLTDFTEKLLAHVQKFRAIKTIVLLRDGVSEGQYSKVLEEEIGAIKKAAKNLKLDVKVVAFIVTKNGNVRHFYHSNNGRIEWESMPHGSFINFGTRYGFQQFYMTAHRSLIGTAKTIMVTKICNEIDISLHEAQEFLLGLTYLHQIVSSPISLPSPINQADAIAQRGQTLYRILKTYCSSKIPINHDGSIDNKKLTELLSINNEALPISRYNA